MKCDANVLPDLPAAGSYDAVILAVAPQQLIDMGAGHLRSFGKPGAVFFDVKSAFPKADSDGRL